MRVSHTRFFAAETLRLEVSDRLRFPLESDTVIQKIADAYRDAGDDPRKVSALSPVGLQHEMESKFNDAPEL